jgi:competence protein ComEC
MAGRILPRLPLVGLALAAAAGILAAEYLSPQPRHVLVFTVVALLATRLFRGVAPLWMAAAGAFAFAHGGQWQADPARQWAELIAAMPRAVKVSGVLIDEPRALTGGPWQARMRTERWEVNGQKVSPGGEIVVRWISPETPRYGDRWTIDGVASMPRGPRNPHEFDHRQWLARQGVFLEVRSAAATQSALEERGQGSPIKAAALTARAWMLRTLGLGLEDEPAIRSLIAGITIGARDAEADQFSEAFRQTGTYHLFSVSGLHVGMFALLLWLVLRPLGLTRRQAVVAIVPLLFFYALVTGASPPSIRAAVMITVAFGGFLLDRPNAPANSLAAAALLLLGWDTNQLFSAGFQLSFFIVAAIFLLAPPLQEWFTARLQPDPFLPRKLYNRWQQATAGAGREVGSTLGVSAAAWLGSLPLTVALFNLVPLLAVPANMLAVPLAFAILAVSMLSLLAGLASAWLAAVFNNTSWGLASLLLAMVQGTAALPGSYVHLPPGWMQPRVRLTVFDLGTGGAQLLRTRQEAWLFDTGTDGDFQRAVEPTLRAAGLGKLGALILTHGDTEHTGGAARSLEAAAAPRIMVSAFTDRSPARRRLYALLEERQLPKSIVLPADRFTAGRDATVEFLAPEVGARKADDQSLVARIETGGFSILLMSDSGAATESALLRRHGTALRSDILVLGRHGEDVFATSEFLAAVQPRVVVLAPADPFREGTDEPALRTRLAESGATIFDQAECGAVITTLRRDAAEVRGFLGGQTVLEPRP